MPKHSHTPAAGPESSPPSLLLALSFPLGVALISVLLGQDSNWDLRNYHVYNVWALLNDRHGIDFLPAQQQTYFSPLMHLPLYFGLMHLPPWLYAALLGAIQGLNGLLVWLLARRLLALRGFRSTWPAFLVAWLGLGGAAFLGQVGSSMGDSLVSLPILAALLLLLGQSAARPWHWLAVGALAGLALALKLTTVFLVFGIGLAVLTVPGILRQRLLRGGVVAATAALTLTLAGGWWLMEMEQRHGNPLMPFYNGIFQSPELEPIDLRDARFLPLSTRDWIAYPLVFAVDPQRVAELRFRDLRLPLLYLGAVLAGLLLLWRRRRPQAAWPFWGLALFLAGSYGVWLYLFGIYRYAVTLELLAPLALLLLLGPLASRGARLLAVALLVLLIPVRPLDFGRTAFGSDFFEVQPPAIASGTLVLIGGTEPLAFLVPFLPSELAYVRVDGNIHRASAAISAQAAARVQAHSGPLVMLLGARDHSDAETRLPTLGLVFAGECQPLPTRLIRYPDDRAVLCPLARI